MEVINPEQHAIETIIVSFSLPYCVNFTSLDVNLIIFPDVHSSRRELLSYCLSLMRSHNSEHLDSLPVLDVSALKHIAYVLDALIYYMRSGMNHDSYSSNKSYNIVDNWNTDQVNVKLFYQAFLNNG